MTAPTKVQLNNREELTRQLTEDLMAFVSGYEYDIEPAHFIKLEDCLALKNTLDRIMLYKQAGRFGEHCK